MMTEQALEQKLEETTDFVQRQQLLKTLWRLRREQELSRGKSESPQRETLPAGMAKLVATKSMPAKIEHSAV
jgi:hypothetical protein